MLSKHEEDRERRATLLNDQRVREQSERRRVFAQDQSLPNQATTFAQFAQSEANLDLGRFSAISNAQVVGQSAAPSYPACSSALAVQLPTEPPLSPEENFAFETSTAFVEASAPALEAPSSDYSPLADDVEPGAGAHFPRCYRRF